ncbi:MAG: hypothetical protein M3O70_13560 [Actinomycetota bacterium]|nr:hypothetical protein [Actinomycetota bacterium]
MSNTFSYPLAGNLEPGVFEQLEHATRVRKRRGSRSKAMPGSDVVEDGDHAGGVFRLTRFAVKPTAGPQRIMDGRVAAGVVIERNPVERRTADDQVNGPRHQLVEFLDAPPDEFQVSSAHGWSAAASMEASGSTPMTWPSGTWSAS